MVLIIAFLIQLQEKCPMSLNYSQLKLFRFPFEKYKWVKVFKNGPNKIYGRQPLKNLK